MGNFRNLAGQTFGRLTVLKRMGQNKWENAVWGCVCKCGNHCEIVSNSLLRGLTKSCGCLQKEMGRNNARPNAARNAVLSSYKAHAKRRGICFSLTDTQFNSLITAECYWCGEPPSNRKISQAGAVLMYSGIDRLDSSGGYTADNSVSCCRPCNFLKRAMPADDFMERMNKISHYQCQKKLGLTTTPVPDTLVSVRK